MLQKVFLNVSIHKIHSFCQSKQESWERTIYFSIQFVIKLVHIEPKFSSLITQFPIKFPIFSLKRILVNFWHMKEGNVNIKGENSTKKRKKWKNSAVGKNLFMKVRSLEVFTRSQADSWEGKEGRKWGKEGRIEERITLCNHGLQGKVLQALEACAPEIPTSCPWSQCVPPSLPIRLSLSLSHSSSFFPSLSFPLRQTPASFPAINRNQDSFLLMLFRVCFWCIHRSLWIRESELWPLEQVLDCWLVF